jgi:N-methylhydantoinase B
MAQIIETNPVAFDTVDVDVVTIDIIENALRNARYEMDAVLFRTAMSPGIREQHDEFPIIADREGRMVVGQFGSFISGFLNTYQGRSRTATCSCCPTPTRATPRSATPTTGWC